ncbi:hypothetical protein D3C73_1062320 [compost metagenome]
MHVYRAFFGFADLIHPADMIEMGMGQQDRLNFHAFDGAHQRSRIHARIDDHTTPRISAGKQIGISLERPQIIGTNIQHRIRSRKSGCAAL